MQGNQATNISMNQEPFNRPPRILLPMPQGAVEIPSIPSREPLPQKPSVVPLLMPVFMVSIMILIYVFVQNVSVQQLSFLLPMAIFSCMSPLTTLVTTSQRTKAVQHKNTESEKVYKHAFEKMRTQLKQQAEEQRWVALLIDPDPPLLEERIEELSHLWERRPDDPDFLAARVGKGARPFSVQVKAPPVDVTDPMADAIQHCEAEFKLLADMPCTISLPRVKSLGITGIRQDVAAFSRAMLCQIATHHSPEDVRILAIYPISQQKDWNWLRELPHTERLKGCELEHLTAVGNQEADILLSFLLEELSQRASKNAEAANTVNHTSTVVPMLPHLVVIVHDYVDVSRHPALTHAFKLGEQLGVSIIYLVAQQQAIPSACRGVVHLSNEGQLSYAAAGAVDDTLEQVTADKIELAYALRLAHALGAIKIVDPDNDAVDLPTNVRLLDLLDLQYVDQLDPKAWWQKSHFGMLRVPIGMSIHGPIWLDLNENVHGPHGIIAGTTGAGKSELLQSLIVGLAITHHPHLVNFVLVDFKGGAAFQPFEKIPHTVGMVTDLSGKLTERALIALKSELRRREHILSQGNATKIAEYLHMRAQNPTRYEPLPHLFIIIDEFAELAKEHPMFMEGLVSVVQKGRSLGVHLILATQKPAGSVNANIWSNLKFRICLRVASLQDSRDMLGRSEAALLPSTIPGRAYFQIGSEVFDLFQSARISLPARVADEAKLAAEYIPGAAEASDMTMLMQRLEPYTETLGLDLFKPWPAPLPYRLYLADVYKRAMAFLMVQAAGQESPLYGWLRAPIGMVDMPMEQRQEPLIIDMMRNGGHVLIAGAGGSGKSVFLRTLIVSLAKTHSAAQLHFYLIDFGGQALRVFEKMPHVGGVFSESDEEYIRRLLRKLDGIIAERKQFCVSQQIEDFQTYQRRRVENLTLPPLPAIVLVIDRLNEFKQAHERDMDLLISIARSGRTYGVYLVLTIDRPSTIPMQLMSLLEMRIGLRMVEATDSLTLLGRSDASYIDPALPGRGYRRGKTLEEVHIALPVTGEDDDEQTHQLEEMMNMFAQNANVPIAQRPQRIRLLPEYVRIDNFLLESIGNTTTSHAHKGEQIVQSLHLRIGIEDFSLCPIMLEINTDTPHALVVGGPGSGRTSALQTCMLMLACPEYCDAKVVLIDFRRSSRPLRRLPNMWMYADTEEHLAETIETLVVELRERIVKIRQEIEQMQDDDDGPIGAKLAPIIVVVDDYEQVSALMKNPLNDLKAFLLQARDLHLHVIVAGTPTDLSRGDTFLQQVKVYRMGIVLGGDASDLQMLGVRMADLPPGRGYLVRRNQRHLVQIAYLAPDTQSAWVTRLLHASSLPHSGTYKQPAQASRPNYETTIA